MMPDVRSHGEEAEAGQGATMNGARGGPTAWKGGAGASEMQSTCGRLEGGGDRRAGGPALVRSTTDGRGRRMGGGLERASEQTD